MDIRPIAQDSWAAELDGFSRRHEGWLVSIKRRAPDGSISAEAHDVPLVGVSPMSADSNDIAVTVGDADNHLTHDVHDAIALRLELTADRAERALAIDAITRRELAELERREREYRQGRPLTDLHGRVVILVDDGLATGSTMRAAVQAVRAHNPARVIVAVPVSAPESCEQLAAIADEVICARTPEPFSAVGLWYRDFSQTGDEEVRELLQRHAQRTTAGGMQS